MLIVKTELGHRVMKDRSVALTPKQRAAFILFDGKRTLEQVMNATKPVGVTREDVDKLFELGLVEDHTSTQMAAQDAAHAAAEKAQAVAVEQHKHRTPQERYAEAYPIATALTAQLGLRGFRLNLAVEGASNYEQLLAVAPKIRDAVGPDKFKPLDSALNDH
jgi:hypothetical protein